MYISVLLFHIFIISLYLSSKSNIFNTKICRIILFGLTCYIFAKGYIEINIQFAMLNGFVKTASRVSRAPINCLPPRAGYACNKIHTPDPTTCSNEALNNNEPLVFPRKNKASPVVQHPEHVVDTCSQEKCEEKVCDTPCSPVVSSKSICHYTHSEKKATSPEPFSTQDFDGKKRLIYTKTYKNPHETSGESVNPERDGRYSKALNEMIKRNNEKK